MNYFDNMSNSELKLKRFIYLCSENSKYVSSNKINYDFCILSQVQSIFELITSNKETVILDLIENANNDPLCVRRETLLFVLAVYIRNAKSEKVKSTALNTILKVCKTTEELFLFIKFSHMLNKNFTNGIKRILRDYYTKCQPDELEKIITNFNSYAGWTHKDIIKLAHIKPKSPVQEMYFIYVLKGLKEAKLKLEEFGEKNSDVTSLIKDLIKNLEKLDAIKHCQDEKQAIELMKGGKYKLQHIAAPLLKSQVVWDEIIPTLEIPDILPHLNRLNRIGILKNNSSTLNKVVELLTDNKKCQSCKIQPGQVFMYLKFFERGKPIDPQRRNYILGLDSKPELNTEQKKKDLITHSNPPKNSAVISALYKLLQLSFKNLYTTGRRVMITLDVKDENMSHFCFVNKSITCIEAAALIAYSFLKAEKDVTVAIFNDTTVKIVPIEKGMNFSQYLQKLKDQDAGFVLLNSPFHYSTENKKPFDVFINLIYSPDSIQRVPKQFKSKETPIDALKRYRQKMHLPNTKMITVSLYSSKLMVADGSPHVLDVCGFDHHVPKIIEACCKGVLQ